MRSEWKETIIGNLCEKIVTGGTPLTSIDKYYKNGTIPWLKTKEVNFVNIYNTENFISDEGLSNSSAKLVPINSVIVAMYGQGDTAGRVAINKIPLATNQACCNLIIDQNHADYRFVFYFLKNSYSELVRRKTGSAQPNLNTKIIKEFEISTPPLPEQKAIAHILGTLDDKIELNRQMNQTLEQMAQGLFKSWFVDFDPVIDNALAQGNTIPEAFTQRAKRRAEMQNSASLPEHILKLFPSEFEESDEMGWMPKGWKVESISAIAILNSESWSTKNNPEYVEYVDLANTKNGRINQTFNYEYKDAPSRAKRILRVDDTIIGTVRPGNRSFAYIHKEGLTGSTGFAVMKPKKNEYRSYTYLCLTQDIVIDYFAHLADGAAYPAVRPEIVANLLTVLPIQDIFTEFDKLVYPYIKKVGENMEEIEILSKLRDTLLPKLIPGELRVGEVGLTKTINAK